MRAGFLDFPRQDEIDLVVQALHFDLELVLEFVDHGIRVGS